MKEEIYAFYSLLRQERLHSKEYVLMCTLEKTRQIAPEMTLEEFRELVVYLTKRYYEKIIKEMR